MEEKPTPNVSEAMSVTTCISMGLMTYKMGSGKIFAQNRVDSKESFTQIKHTIPIGNNSHKDCDPIRMTT